MWNSSLFTSIVGAFCGGLLAFGIAYIQINDQRKQQDKQRNIEIQKAKIEIKIKSLDFISSILTKNMNNSKVIQIYLNKIIDSNTDKKELMTFRNFFEYYFNTNSDSMHNVFDICLENNIDNSILEKLKEFSELLNLIDNYIDRELFKELKNNFNIDDIKSLSNDINYWSESSKRLFSFFKNTYESMQKYNNETIPNEKIRLLESIGK